MKYEEVFKRSREVKAPNLDIKTSSVKKKHKAMDSIVSQLKQVDRRTRISIRLLQVLYGFMIATLSYYIAVQDDSMVKAGLGSILAAFILVIWVQQLRYNAYQYDYNDSPVLESLLDARSRMQVFTNRTWLVIPIWILIDVGICLLIANLLPDKDYIDDVIISIQFVLIGLIAIDFYVAYRIWKRDNEPVLMEIDKMIEELSVE